VQFSVKTFSSGPAARAPAGGVQRAFDALARRNERAFAPAGTRVTAYSLPLGTRQPRICRASAIARRPGRGRRPGTRAAVAGGAEVAAGGRPVPATVDCAARSSASGGCGTDAPAARHGPHPVPGSPAPHDTAVTIVAQDREKLAGCEDFVRLWPAQVFATRKLFGGLTHRPARAGRGSGRLHHEDHPRLPGSAGPPSAARNFQAPRLASSRRAATWLVPGSQVSAISPSSRCASSRLAAPASRR
jgi:hypothetical protein